MEFKHIYDNHQLFLKLNDIEGEVRMSEPKQKGKEALQ
jgi:hypothetical protein